MGDHILFLRRSDGGVSMLYIELYLCDYLREKGDGRQEIELCLWVVPSTTARKLGCSTGLVAMLLLTRTGIAGLAFLNTSNKQGYGGGQPPINN